MSLSISCRELGMDCLFLCKAETEEAVIESLIRHVQSEHDDEDWFDVETIHQAAVAAIRGKAA